MTTVVIGIAFDLESKGEQAIADAYAKLRDLGVTETDGFFIEDILEDDDASS